MASCLVHGQEFVSYSNSNYAGINAADINPSFIAYSRLRSDINFLQVRTQLFNNNFYANPQFVPGLFFREQIKGGLANSQNAEGSSSGKIILSENINSNTNFFANAIAKGPGFMTSDGFRAFAVQTHVKTIADLNNISPEISRMLFEQTDYTPLINKGIFMEKGAGFSMMSYGEVDFTYAKMLNNRKNKIINIGVTGKVLVGFAAMYMRSGGTLINFSKRNNIESSNLVFDFGYAMPDEKAGEGAMIPRGLGLGADIGFSYIRKKNSRLYKYGCPSFIRKVCFMPNYKWKFGASILDLGGIHFSTLANNYVYNGTVLSWDSISFTPIKTIQELDQTLQQKASNPSSIEKSFAFYMSLPTALSLQFDYNVNDAVFINTTWVQRMNFGSNPAVRRMNIFAVSPRYETDQVEVALPVQLLEYSQPAIGLMMRYRNIFAGTDQLGSTMGLTRLNGADLYLGFKMNIQGDYSPSSINNRRKKKARNLNVH